MADAIAGMKTAYAQLSTQQAVVPLRAHVDVAAHQGTSLIMPAYLKESDDLAVKIVSVFPNNPQRNEPTIYASVMVLDAETGRPLAMMEGGTLTAIRTGAGSGAATDLLARPDASVVAILGSGVQARTQLEAVCTVRDIREVRIYSPTNENAVLFAREVKGKGRIPQLVRIMRDADTAVKGADIICAATTSTTPVLNGKLLEPGVHINGVGSFQPSMQEFDEENGFEITGRCRFSRSRLGRSGRIDYRAAKRPDSRRTCSRRAWRNCCRAKTRSRKQPTNHIL